MNTQESACSDASHPPESIYLDHASTTPMDAVVEEAVSRASRDAFANPSSSHAAGRRARHLLEEARERVLSALGGVTTARARDQLVFTSGATEANHLGLRGCLAAMGEGGAILVTARDHSSLRGAAAASSGTQRPVIELPLDASGLPVRAGQTTPPALAATVTLVCGQTGSIDLPERGLPSFVHCDATQSAGLMELAFDRWPFSTLVVAPHKFGGPRGIGCLVVRHGLACRTLVPGTQEFGLRAGTEAVGLAVGFAVAIERSLVRRQESATHLNRLRALFEQNLAGACDSLGISTVVIAAAAPRAPHISTIAFFRGEKPIDRQAIVMAADLDGICCSTGAACASGSSEPAPALVAMRLPRNAANAAVRFSFSPHTTDADVAYVLRQLPHVVSRCLTT